MTNLKTTVIAKTDIAGYTPRVAQLSRSELSSLLVQHKNLIGEIVARSEGKIVKGEGDAFWITFPSVAAAALAAIEMHNTLRAMQVGRQDGQQLAIRVAIAVGDILLQENDIFGMAVNLAARIEAITPAGEIYLSHAAWLILNKAEAPTSYVGSFNLKGIAEPEMVYRVEQKRSLHTLTGQAIFFTDLRKWTRFSESHPLADVENVLNRYNDLINAACLEHGGIIRNIAGDSYFFTFPYAVQALAAADHIQQAWAAISAQYSLGLSGSIHLGDMYILRSYLFGKDINTAALLSSLTPDLDPQGEHSIILVTEAIYHAVQGSPWEARLQRIEWHSFPESRVQELARTFGAYQFLALYPAGLAGDRA